MGGPRTPAKLRSTSSSLPCRALLTSASEVTSSLTRTETCEKTCGRIQTPSAPYLRSDGQSSGAHFRASRVSIKQEMHGAPAGFASWVDAVIVGPATVLNFCVAPIFQVVLIARKAWEVLGVLVGVASPDV